MGADITAAEMRSLPKVGTRITFAEDGVKYTGTVIRNYGFAVAVAVAGEVHVVDSGDWWTVAPEPAAAATRDMTATKKSPTRCQECRHPIWQRANGTWTLTYMEHDKPDWCFGERGDLGKQRHRPGTVPPVVQPLRGYAKLIAEAIGTTDPATLALVEQVMRDDAGGALDGLTPAAFGAMARCVGCELRGDPETARLIAEANLLAVPDWADVT